jgi:AhpD family alkylhydroperoxidase
LDSRFSTSGLTISHFSEWKDSMSNRIDYATASPEGYKAFGGVYATLRKSGLPQEMINLVYLRVSQINGCAYCIDKHTRDLLKLGVAMDKIVLVPVWRDSVEAWPKPTCPMPTMKPRPPNSAPRNSRI